MGLDISYGALIMCRSSKNGLTIFRKYTNTRKILIGKMQFPKCLNPSI